MTPLPDHGWFVILLVALLGFGAGSGTLAQTQPGSGTPDPGDQIFHDRFEGPPNEPPLIEPIPDQTISALSQFSYQVVASDPWPPWDVLHYELYPAPDGMAIDAEGGLISWRPGLEQIGAHPVTVWVSDAYGGMALEDFQITVTESDFLEPNLAAIADQVIALGDTLTLIAEGDDPQKLALRYSVAGPTGMVINTTSGELGWRPGVGQIGGTSATVSVTNEAGLSASADFAVTVLDEPENTPPTLDPVPDQVLLPGEMLTLQLVASDPDIGEVLSYGVLSAPAGLTVDPHSGLLGWIPGPDQVGTSEVTAQVTDLAGAKDSTSFSVVVLAAPIAVEDVYGVKRGTIQQPSVLEVEAPGVLDNDTSPSGLAMSAELLTGPSRGTLGAFNPDGSFSYTPDVAPPQEIEFAEVCNSAAAFTNVAYLQQTPIVVDLDGDGVPEIVWLDSNSGQGGTALRAMSMVNGNCELLWETDRVGSFFTQNPDYGVLRSTVPLAAGDVTGDGRPEIVAVVEKFPCSPEPCTGSPRPLYSHIALFDADGEFLWISEPVAAFTSEEFGTGNGFRRSVPHIADLTGNGRGEIVLGVRWNTLNRFVIAFRHVEDADGTQRGEVLFETRGTISDGTAGENNAVHIVDLDLDGVPEILFGNDVYSNTGERLYSLPVPRGFGSTFSPENQAIWTRTVIVNLDDDPFPEIVVMAGSGLYAFKHDGTEIWRGSIPWSGMGPLAAADLTGDGWPEIVLMPGERFEAWDRHGNRLWESERRFRSSLNHGATAFDLNNNGRSEVVISRDWAFDGNTEDSYAVVLDGLTGEVIAEMTTSLIMGRSSSPRTMPVIADATGDGRANLVTWMNGIGQNWVTIIGGTEANPWGPARPVWNQYTYHGTNINTDGTVASPMRPHWLLPGLNAYHVNVPLPGEDDSGQDSFTYRVLAGGLSSEPATVSIDITANINPPRIISTPITAASPGFAYQYGVLAIDADLGDVLTYALASAPDGMSIDPDFGLIDWLPEPDQLGSHPVSVTVTDSTGLSDAQTFSVEVAPPVSVPDLSGLAESEAVDQLLAAGLSVGTVSQRYNTTVAAGLLIAQGLPAGSPAALGAQVGFSVSLGPQPLPAPNLVGLNRSVALAALSELELVAGSISRQNSDSVPRNQVLAQSVTPGSTILAGSSMDLVVSSGPALLIELERDIIGAGDQLLFASTLFDADGNPVTGVEAAVEVLPTSTSDGSAPTVVSSSELATSVDTRGQWRLQIQRGVETREVRFLVLGQAGAGGALEPFAEFSSQLNAMGQTYTALIDAMENGDMGVVPALASDLQALRDAINLQGLELASIAAPEQGFLPPWNIGALGVGPIGGDDWRWNARLGELISALDGLEAFSQTLLAGRPRNDDLRGQALVAHAADRADALLALEPGARGLLFAQDRLWQLTSERYPAAVVAGLDRVLTELAAAGLMAAVDETPPAFYTRAKDAAGRQSPEAFYADLQLRFFSLAGLMTVQVNKLDLAKQIYLPVVQKLLINFAPLLASELLTSAWDVEDLEGVITGASLSFHNFYVGNSVIESRFAGGVPAQNSIVLIGPDLFQQTVDFLDGLDEQTVQSVGDAALGFKQLLDNSNPAAGGSLNGCVFTTSSCRQLVLPNGFPSVYTDIESPFPAPVLIVTYNAVSGRMASTVALFFSAEAE